MLVQAHKLAAKAFVDEIHHSIANIGTKHIAELSTGLDNCLQGLQALQETLVMFPDSDPDDDMTL